MDALTDIDETAMTLFVVMVVNGTVPKKSTAGNTTGFGTSSWNWMRRTG